MSKITVKNTNFKIDHQWLVNTRREFHSIPEASSREYKTSALIIQKLREIGLPNTRSLAGTGVSVDIGTGEGPVLAIRADIDALPVTEKKNPHNEEYISQNEGMMHACGHDAHITTALGTLKAVVESDIASRFTGTLRVFFQPAEETGSGAQKMIKDGVLDNPPVDRLIALHVDPSIYTGQIGIRRGVAFAACDTIKIEITGKDGHGSSPHNVKDPIVAASHLVTQLQTIVSRNIDPLSSAVISIGSFNSGNRFNIIPEKAVLEGTCRSLDSKTRRELENRISRMCSALKETFDLEDCTLDYHKETPVGFNSVSFAKEVTEIIKNLVGEENLKEPNPSMGAEDFAFYSRELNGDLRDNAPLTCFVRLGVTNRSDAPNGITVSEIAGLHNAAFDLDENALDTGVAFFLHVIDEYLLK